MKKKKTYLDRMKRLGPEKKLSLDYLVYDIARLVLFPFCKLWYRPVVLYENEAARRPVKGTAIVIANHQSYKDPIHLGCCVFPYRRIRFVGLHNFFERPSTRWLFPGLLVIPVNRDNTSLISLQEIMRSLKNQWMVAIYPEGHVNWDSSLSEFRLGIAAFAANTKAPVVPVYILKRKKSGERLICAVGEAVNYPEKQASSLQSTETERQEAFCNTLLEKEKELEHLCIEYHENKYSKS